MLVKHCHLLGRLLCELLKLQKNPTSGEKSTLDLKKKKKRTYHSPGHSAVFHKLNRNKTKVLEKSPSSLWFYNLPKSERQKK